MSAPREIPDFAVLARRAFESALRRLDPAISTGSIPGAGCTDPAVALILSVVSGAPFRLVTRHNGLHRPEAKRVLERFALSSTARHLSFMDEWEPSRLTHTSAWSFNAKDRGGRPSRLSRLDPRSVWIHLWVDVATGLLAAWNVGPQCLSAWPAHTASGLASVMKQGMRLTSASSQSPAERCPPESDSWLAALDGGLFKKVRAQALVVAVLTATHNFCAIDGARRSPAMRAGWTNRPWTLEELVHTPAVGLRQVSA